MADWTVTRVSEDEPREYFNEKYKTTTYYIKVKVQGHNKPISVGKKSPDAIKVGDIISGEIQATEYQVDNFKPEKKAPGGGGGSYHDNPEKSAEIKAEWAIGQAMSYYTAAGQLHPQEDISIEFVEYNAIQLFAMVDRVKNSGSEGQARLLPSTGSSTTQDSGNEPQDAADSKPPTRDWNNVGRKPIETGDEDEH